MAPISKALFCSFLNHLRYGRPDWCEVRVAERCIESGGEIGGRSEPLLQLVRTLLLQVLSSDEKASFHTRGHLDAYCFANFLHPPQLALHLLFGASWCRTHGVQLFVSRLDLLSVPNDALA